MSSSFKIFLVLSFIHFCTSRTYNENLPKEEVTPPFETPSVKIKKEVHEAPIKTPSPEDKSINGILKPGPLVKSDPLSEITPLEEPNKIVKSLEKLSPQNILSNEPQNFFMVVPVGTQERIPLLFNGNNAYCILIPNAKRTDLVPLKSSAFSRKQIINSLKINEDRLANTTQMLSIIQGTFYLVAKGVLMLAEKNKENIVLKGFAQDILKTHNTLKLSPQYKPIKTAGQAVIIGGILSTVAIKSIAWVSATQTFEIMEKEGVNMLKSKKKWNEGDYKNALLELQKLIPETTISCLGN